MTNTTDTVTSLLTAEGCGPWLTSADYAAAVWLAEAVRWTIARPISRAKFAAEAAEWLAEVGPSRLAGLEAEAVCLAETAEAQRPTPCGSTELWGSFTQFLN